MIRSNALLGRTLWRKAYLYSLAILAAPAANVCSPAASNIGAPLPCNVDATLRQRCQACHGATPQYGAPMPLTTYDDVHAPAPNIAGKSVYEVMLSRITDPNNPMPPKGQTPLTDQEKADLVDWLGKGAPAGTGACQNLPSPANLNALTGPEYLPCTPDVYFRAHGSGTDKYSVSASNGNAADYECFTFPSPFGNKHAVAWAPVIDTGRVVHHWLLFGTTSSANLAPGSACEYAVFNTLVAGWAPGGANIVNDPDVSLSLDFPYFVLQIHYLNPTSTAVPDSSGVGFCTGAPRQNVAGMVTLGTNGISIPPYANGQAVGTCNDNALNSLALDNATPITVIRTYPHMHLTGRTFRTEHVGHPDLSNIADWNFNVQVQYPILPRRVVLPGETLTTTCTYQNDTATTIQFGAATTDEMCYDFITAYPIASARRKCGPFL